MEPTLVTQMHSGDQSGRVSPSAAVNRRLKLDEENTTLGSPIDVLYLIHDALRKQADRVEKMVKGLQEGSSLNKLFMPFPWRKSSDHTDHNLFVAERQLPANLSRIGHFRRKLRRVDPMMDCQDLFRNHRRRLYHVPSYDL